MLSVQDFATRIRQKSWGAYKDVDDITLTQAIVDKYPEYKSQVQFSTQKWTSMFPAKALDNYARSQWTIQEPQAGDWRLPFSSELWFRDIEKTPQKIADFVKKPVSFMFWKQAGESVDELAESFRAPITWISSLWAWVYDIVPWLQSLVQWFNEKWIGFLWDIYQSIAWWVKQAGKFTADTLWQWTMQGAKDFAEWVGEFWLENPLEVFEGWVWLKWVVKWALWAWKFAKNMIENPQFKTYDLNWAPTWTKTAKQVVWENFKEAGSTLFWNKKLDWKGPMDPTWGIPRGPKMPFDDWPTNWWTTFDTPFDNATDFTSPGSFDDSMRWRVWTIAEKIGSYVGKKVDKVTTPVAQMITKNKTGSQKLFSAVAPRYNKLVWRNTKAIANMNKNIQTVWSVALALNMRPRNLSDFVDATEEIISIMGSKVQEKLWRDLTVDMSYIASKIDDYVNEKAKSWIVTDKAGLDKLREQADAFRQMGAIDVAQANKLKQELNSRASWDDPDLTQVLKNWYTSASVALWDALSTLLSDLPGEFRYYKETMGAGLSIMDDLMKSLTQEMKKSTNGIVESYGRISWLKDAISWAISLKWGQVLWWLWTFIIWEAYGKLKNKDFLVDEWFKQLYQEAGIPEPKNPYIPKRSDFSNKGESWITDEQVMKDYAWGKRYNEFVSEKQAKEQAFEAEKKMKETELQKRKEEMDAREMKRKKERDEAIEVSKRAFKSAIDSWLYEEINVSRIPVREWDLTELSWKVIKAYMDRSVQKIDTELWSWLLVYEVGKIARKTQWSKIAPKTDTDPSGPENPTDDEYTPLLWEEEIIEETPTDIANNIEDSTKPQVKWYKQAEYLRSAEQLIWTTIDSISDEWINLYNKAVNAKSTKNRLDLIDELLFSYWTTEAKSAYLLDIAENWSKKDIQNSIDLLNKYWFWKENSYSPDEFNDTIKYLEDLLIDKKDGMGQTSLFDFTENDTTTTTNTAWWAIPDDSGISQSKAKNDWDITPSDGENGWGWKTNVSWGLWRGTQQGVDNKNIKEELKSYNNSDDFLNNIFEKEIKEDDIVYYKDSMNNIAKAIYKGKDWFWQLKLQYIWEWPLWTDWKNIDPIKLYWKLNITSLQSELENIRNWNIEKRINFEKEKWDYDVYKKTTDIEMQIRKIREDLNFQKTESKPLSKKTKESVKQDAINALERTNFATDPALYTADELNTFKTYSGVSWLTKEAWILDQFYTPSRILKKMRELAGKYNQWWPIQNVLEPSAGIGRVALVGSQNVKYDLFEIDKTAGTIAKILNPDANVVIGDFQDKFMDGRKPKNYQWKYYDVAISNPPYKTRNTIQRGLWELPDFDRFEDYFTFRQLQMVKPGGLVITIVPSSFLDKWVYKAKYAISEIGNIVDAYRLPNGAFPDTNIGTDILVIRKEPGNINYYANWSYFVKNPDKILWTVEKTTDQWGKQINIVKWSIDNIEKISWSKEIPTRTPKAPITSWMFSQAPIKKELPKKEGIFGKKKKEITTIKEDIETETLTLWNPDPKILQYQKDVNVLWHLDWYTVDDIAKDPDWLNLQNGLVYSDYHYLQGNIYDKLKSLEWDRKRKMIPDEMYERQKKKLEEILPTPRIASEIQFSPFDKSIVDIRISEWTEIRERDSKERAYMKKIVYKTIKDDFVKRARDNKPTNILSDVRQIRDIIDGKVSKWDWPIKANIQMDAQKLFNIYMNEWIPLDLQQSIVDNYNKTLNGYVKPDNKSQPIILEWVAKSFKWAPFKFTKQQIEGINHLTNKWSGLIAYGVWVGKTITWLWATILAMQKGRTKRPLFIVPKSTLNDTWIGTISKLFPGYEIVNLWWLGVPDIKRLSTQYWSDPKNWIKDGQIAITTFQWMKNLTLTDDNAQMVTRDLQDSMGKSPEWKTAKQQQKENEKIDLETGKALKTTGKEIYLEDLWIDHLTIDEGHNVKNIFQSAEAREWENNPYWSVLKWTSSDMGRKAYMISQHIMRKNKNRWVYILTATPFNNQPIEVYNILSLMAKKRLEDMGIKNINDFFSKFSYIQNEKVISPMDFRKNEERPVMKSFSNVGELQMLLTEFIDYKSSEKAETMMPRPDKKVGKHVLKNSPIQENINQKIREYIKENRDKDGIYLVTMGQSILNATSPYFVNTAFSKVPKPISWSELFMNSPKLSFALDMTKKTLDSGKWHVFRYLEQWVDYHPMIVKHIQEQLWLRDWEVDFISWNMKQEKKDLVAEWFRSGKVKVLVGWQTTAEGIDLQKYGVTTMFFSLSWNPTRTVQAGWRVWRPGNPRSGVYEAYLLNEDSGDLYLMQKYEEKSSRINDIFSYQWRVFEDKTMTDWEAKMALLTDPEAKAEQQMNMDKIELENKIQYMKNQMEKNSSKIKVIEETYRRLGKDKDALKYYQDLKDKGTLPSYQKDTYDTLKSDIQKKQKKLDDIFKRHDKDYTNDPDKDLKVIQDLNESNKAIFDETKKIDEEIRNIEKKMPEYLEFFIEERRKIEQAKKTTQQQIDEYGQFLDTIEIYER